MLYIPDPNPKYCDRPTEGDILDIKAYDHGFALGLKGLPALKWRGCHGSHAATAAIAYKKGLATRNAAIPA